jgi:hypothetical protein
VKIKDSEATVIHADNFATEHKYRMTLEHEGETYYWEGFMGEYGLQDYWYDHEGKLIVEPDWVDEIEDSLFDIAEDKARENEKSFDWLVTKLKKFMPNATFERDNDGQIVIYTDLEEDSTGTVKKLNSDEEDDSDIYTEEVK